MPINSLLYPSNVFVPTTYNVDNSLRFNDGSTDSLSRSNGTPTSRRIFTFSGWYKRSVSNAGEIINNYLLFIMIIQIEWILDFKVEILLIFIILHHLED